MPTGDASIKDPLGRRSSGADDRFEQAFLEQKRVDETVVNWQKYMTHVMFLPI